MLFRFMTTGLALVREQVRIAQGETISVQQADLRQTGHALECRIYAEVPEENFRPDVGTIAVYRPPLGPGVRLDSGVQEGSVVGFDYDPMLAKLVVWAPTRTAAIERMGRALNEFVLLGVRNNIEFLNRVISHEEFRAGRFDTHFLEAHPELLNPGDRPVPHEALIAAALGSTSQAVRHTPTAGSTLEIGRAHV